MPWLQLSIEAPEDQAPFAEWILQELGALSVTLGDAADQPLLEPALDSQTIWRSTRVTGLFPAERDAQALHDALAQTLNPASLASLRIERLEDRVWERVWLDDFRPMKFGRRLWICPDGMPPGEADAVKVELDPGLAFGTGTHPTTALCLTWLDSQPLSGLSVLDYGCGSGILAIAALRLGAARAIGVDYDPQAIQASRDNARKNGVSERLLTYLPEQLPQLEADLLLANILAAPLIELAPRLRGLLRPGGRFALSGILREQGEQVHRAYAAWAALDAPESRDEWLLLSGEKHR